MDLVESNIKPDLVYIGWYIDWLVKQCHKEHPSTSIFTYVGKYFHKTHSLGWISGSRDIINVWIDISKLPSRKV